MTQIIVFNNLVGHFRCRYPMVPQEYVRLDNLKIMNGNGQRIKSGAYTDYLWTIRVLIVVSSHPGFQCFASVLDLLHGQFGR